MFLSVLPPLKCITTPCLLQIFFRLSPIPSMYGTTMWLLVWCLLLGVFFFSLCWCLSKIFFMAHLGYLHAPSTSSRCCSSCSANSGVEQMVWALCVSVLMTLYLAAMLWLLSHGRYRSVWVGFLYTPIVKLPYSSGLMIVSRKGMEPSSFASSTVNWIEGSTVLMCWRNSSWCFCCCTTKVSSTYLFQTLGGAVLLW